MLKETIPPKVNISPSANNHMIAIDTAFTI